MIFQFFSLLDDLTVAGNVLLPAQLTGQSRAQARSRGDELLAVLRIKRHADAYPGRRTPGWRVTGYLGVWYDPPHAPGADRYGSEGNAALDGQRESLHPVA
jgi:hypothetical protein